MGELVRFSRSLYDPAAVRDAVTAFDALASFEVVESETHLDVTITEPDTDLADVLADELCNHALANTIAMHREVSDG